MVVRKLHMNVNQWNFGWRFIQSVVTPPGWMARMCPLLCGPAALVIQCVWYRFYCQTVAVGRQHKPSNTREWLSTALQKTTHHTSFSALVWLQQCKSGGYMQSHTQSLPPSNDWWLLLCSVCKKREQICDTTVELSRNHSRSTVNRAMPQEAVSHLCH